MPRSVVAADHGRGSERGQSLVEFAVLVPVFMLILIGMLEFGLMFNHDLTLQYASREGARVGAALGCGATSNNPACDSGFAADLSNPQEVDPYVVAAVERVLEASGSPIKMGQVGSITIFKADASGRQVGTIHDVWVYSLGNGPSVDGQKLDFEQSASTNWPDGNRKTSTVAGNDCGGGLSACPDSIGVRITYTYQYVTPLAAVLGFFGGPGASTQSLDDQTVMALNPTS